MSDIIQLLPDSVANQIAAGEVIQRPANVIKELVENSIDAGAKTINILVVDAGKTSIQVIDDGRGMSVTDARLAFDRHATSKIRKAEDLFALRTMGFRGEALPSIAAVSHVELITRQESDELGTCINITASRVLSQEPCSCPVGCNFKVENLLFNEPGRRKFLKTAATELSNILTAFERIALVYPEVNFTVHSNGGSMFNLKAGNLKKRITDIFKKVGPDLLSVEEDTSICKITGFVGKPESAKPKCSQQYFFVNGRFMRHAYFAKAVQEAYDRMIPQGYQVPYFIYLDVDPASIDVNVSPTKTEIKFEHEQNIFSLLMAAVRSSVAMYKEVPTLDFDIQGKPDIPVFDDHSSSTFVPHESQPKYNPFKTEKSHEKQAVPMDWQKLYENVRPSEERPIEDFFSLDEQFGQGGESPVAEKSPTHYQYKGKYIITSVKSGLMIIDQHRAHSRILYENYLRQIEERKPQSQRMLFPEAVQFSSAEMLFVDEVIDEMAALGFELTPLGAGCYAINSVPAGSEGLNPSVLIQEMVDEAVQNGSHVKDEINKSLAMALASRAAIPYGQVLGNEEMEDVIDRLFACSNINYTPDGRKIYYILRQDEIEKTLG